MKRYNIKGIFITLFGLLFISTHSYSSDAVIASVNGVPILESQVKTALGKKAYTENNRKVALDNIIDDILVNQAIKNSGISVTNAQVDKVIEDIAASNGLTFGQLLDALDYQGINYQQYRNQIANQLLMSEVRNQAIGKSLEVSHEEVQELGNKLFAQAKELGQEKKATATEYQVRHILLKLTPLLNDTQAKALLTKIRSDILNNKMTFEEAALKYSKDYLSGANGGNLGFAFPETYVPPFARVVLTTPKGKISLPFKTEFGWHILEVTNTRQVDSTKDIYMQEAYQKLVNKQLQDVSKDWVKILRKNADIKYFN
ncbi:peptidylprolyl isomerase [Avibacterium paragallinarum]|uniref:peptidylprolyl isomerase n=1 Tax=Avibacterium paragallinarum TaxID=728 RepID=UPI00397AD751